VDRDASLDGQVEYAADRYLTHRGALQRKKTHLNSPDAQIYVSVQG